jgi:hypothetical protein
MKKDKCVKGVSCGLTCINRNNDCLSEFPPKVQPYVQKLAEKLSQSGYGSEEDVLADLEAARILSSMKKPEFRLFQEQQKMLSDPEFSEKSPEEQFNILTKMKNEAIEREVQRVAEEGGDSKAQEKVRQGFSESYWDRALKDKKFKDAFEDMNEDEQQAVVEGLLLVGGQPRDKGRIVSSSPEEMLFLHNKADELQKALDTSLSADGGVDPGAPGGVKDARDRILRELNGDTYGENIDFDKVSSLVYSALPNNVKSNLQGAGSITNKDEKYLVRDIKENGMKESEANVLRAQAILKEYLKQGGRDIYTGKIIPLYEADLEHIVPADQGGAASEQPNNWAFTRSDINKGRGKKSFKDYVDNGPTKALGLVPGQQATLEDVEPKVIERLLKKAQESSRDNVEKNILLRGIGINLQPGEDGLQDLAWLSRTDSETVGMMKKMSEALSNMEGETKNGKLLKAIAKVKGEQLLETIKAEEFARGNRRFEWLKKMKAPGVKPAIVLADWLAKSYVKALEQGDIEEIRKLEEFMFKLPQERFPTGVKSGEISPVIKEVFEEMGFNL